MYQLYKQRQSRKLPENPPVAGDIDQKVGICDNETLVVPKQIDVLQPNFTDIRMLELVTVFTTRLSLCARESIN
jgi:hypothetical protein